MQETASTISQQVKDDFFTGTTKGHEFKQNVWQLGKKMLNVRVS